MAEQKPPPVDPELLTGMVRYLLDRVYDLTVRVETMRGLLDAYAGVSPETFEAARQRAESQLEALRQKTFAEAAKQADAEKWRRLLADFEGTKQ